MDTTSIIAALTAQRDRLDQAIAALRGRTNQLTLSGKRDGRRRARSASSRRKVSQAMKKRWAEWRRKQAAS